MKYLTHLALALALSAVKANPVKRDNPQGIDVSSHQPDIDWNSVVSNGIVFAYIKATEGTDYISTEFNSQYTGATNVGLIRGSYHFALPDASDGATQANYFLAHGGGWSADGITLPGAVDLESNPYGDQCYGLSSSAMVTWITDFSNTYHAATGRYPVFYTSISWWTACTGNSDAFGNNNPLWLASWNSSPGTLPAGWEYYSFWQYADSGPNPGDADLWNGDLDGLKRMALGS
ncbi:hypothetical protein ID866_4262 [Astraeus odoratus]|nr:hypothetical protein ID866_4262 [Astraeus odoratus]